MIKWNIHDDVIELTASAKLTDRDYEQLLPVIDHLLELHSKPKFKIILDDFKGWELSALWSDLKYDLKHGREFGPMAVIGEDISQKWLAQFSDIFFPSDIRYFDHDAEREAEEWLEEEGKGAHPASPLEQRDKAMTSARKVQGGSEPPRSVAGNGSGNGKSSAPAAAHYDEGGQPPQHQDHQPGRETEMSPPPRSFMENYKAAGKLEGKTLLISGGDSGIGRAVSIAFAKEGADIAMIYLEEEEDARETEDHILAEGQQCIRLCGDIADPAFCKRCVEETMEKFGKIDILINNAGEQHTADALEDISPEQLQRTFATNVFGAFYLTQAVLPHLKENASIINTVSITAYRGQPVLMDYAATKGALVALTRSLTANLVKKGIRVNGVAPGPVWTPLIPSSFDADEVAEFGESAPMGRAGQPDEIAPAYVFLASSDSSYMTGQVLHPNGGTIIAG